MNENQVFALLVEDFSPLRGRREDSKQDKDQERRREKEEKEGRKKGKKAWKLDVRLKFLDFARSQGYKGEYELL